MASKTSKPLNDAPSKEDKRAAYLADLRQRAGHEFDPADAASVELTVLHKERTASQEVSGR